MVFEKVVAILAEFVEVDPKDITPVTNFKELGLDSLDTVDMLMKVEEEFGLTVEMNEELRTVGDVVDFIEKASAK